MPLTLSRDELNVLKEELEIAEIDNNEEWFSEYPYDADLRTKYCDELEWIFYEYFLECEDLKRPLTRDGFFLRYLSWLMYVANETYNNATNAIDLFEKEFAIDIVRQSSDFAEVAMDSKETSKFNLFEKVYGSFKRARNIARTETNKLCNRMLHEVGKRLYNKHMWVSEHDDRVRETHAMANGQIRDIDQPFDIGNSLMYYPCDISMGASISEIVNCRCHERFIKNEPTTKTKENVVEVQSSETQTTVHAFPNNVREATEISDGVYRVWEYFVDDEWRKVDGVDVVSKPSDREIEVAGILREYFNEDVYLLPEIYKPRRRKMADYQIDGIKYDLKQIKPKKELGKATMYNAVHQKKLQSKRFVFDVTLIDNQEWIDGQINEVFRNPYSSFVQRMMLVRENKIVYDVTREEYLNEHNK